MKYTKEQISQAMELRPTLWIKKYAIKTETGEPIDFIDHPFLWDIYNDLSPKFAVLKAAQIGLTTLQILKSFWVAKKKRLDIIYTLPTESDVQQFASGKVNRIIAQNPILQAWTKDKDSVEQKAVGDNLIYYRGTWTQKAAIMVSSDLNIYDEVDASKQLVIEQYATRLQHSPHKWEWYFSHPSAEGTGVDIFWQRSDQKHWFIKCESDHCAKEQYLAWPESIDPAIGQFVCRYCKETLSDNARRQGRWIARYPGREFSGYWIPLLICPWVSAPEILDYHKHKTEEYFYNKVLGLPYVGGGNKLTKAALFKNLTSDVLTPENSERIIIGVDTGLKLDYVMWGMQGIFFQGEAEKYAELDALMTRWKKAIVFMDGGGDLIGSREFQARWPGRVYLVFLAGDKKNTDEPVWNDDEYMVSVDRNKFIQIVVDEFTKGKIPLQGTEDEWYEYYLDWNNLTRIKVYDSVTQEFKGTKWVRNGRDHRALATVIARVGFTRFSSDTTINSQPTNVNLPKGYEIKPDQSVEFNPKTFFKFDKPHDWRRS